MHILKAAAAAAVVAVLLAAPLGAGAEETAAATLTVTGQGTISRAPDLATVSVTIVTNDPNAQRALSENNRRFAALSAKLTALGIAADDITSTSLGSYYNPRPDGPAVTHSEPYGYVVTRNVDIKARSVDSSGAVVDAAAAAGANQINGVSYGFRDRRAVEREALAAAVADAYAQAQTLAAAAHVRIERVLSIGDGSAPIRPQPMAMAMMKTAMTADAVPTTIKPSDLDVSSSITVTYAIR